MLWPFSVSMASNFSAWLTLRGKPSRIKPLTWHSGSEMASIWHIHTYTRTQVNNRGNHRILYAVGNMNVCVRACDDAHDNVIAYELAGLHDLLGSETVLRAGLTYTYIYIHTFTYMYVYLHRGPEHVSCGQVTQIELVADLHSLGTLSTARRTHKYRATRVHMNE
jgi:hypothetical protein